MIDLKPCPFCGGEAEKWYHSDDGSFMGIQCINDDCECDYMGSYDGEEITVKRWNTRTCDERIAKLEAELAEEREQRRLLMDDNRKLLMGNFEVIKENQKLRDWIGSALDRFPEIELDMDNPLEGE